jgi:hypothetical protein
MEEEENGDEGEYSYNYSLINSPSHCLKYSDCRIFKTVVFQARNTRNMKGAWL